MIPRRLQKLETEFHSSDPARRQTALDELSAARHPFAFELLFQRAEADDSDDAAAARRAFEQLVRSQPTIALRHERLEIRRAAARVLGDARCPDAIGELSRILRNDSDELLRTASAEALSRISRLDCAAGLGHARLDSALKVRQIALSGLRKLTGAAAENAIVLFLDETDWGQRTVAQEHLENCGWTPATKMHRAHWAITLGRFDDAISQGDDSVRALVFAATRIDNAEVRHWATVALSRLRRHEVEAELRQALISPDRGVRVAAAAALNELGIAVSIPEIPATPLEAAARRDRQRESLFHQVVRLLALAGEV